MNPLVMYLIVRSALTLSPGKLGAQCGHAVQMAMLSYFGRRTAMLEGAHENTALCEIMDRWFEGDYTKIVLRADEKEWAKLKTTLECPFFVVQDAGRTELPSGTETVMALWPMLKGDAPKLIQRLQLLK